MTKALLLIYSLMSSVGTVQSLSCPNGGIPIKGCVNSGSCPTGFYCAFWFCCLIPACASPAIPVQQCDFYTRCTLPLECVNGRCCNRQLTLTSTPEPFRCASGMPPVTPCMDGICPIGFNCESNQCCISGIAKCAKLCAVTQHCGSSEICLDSCCAVWQQKCPCGLMTVQKCLTTSDCDKNQICFNGGCCPTFVPQIDSNTKLTL